MTWEEGKQTGLCESSEKGGEIGCQLLTGRVVPEEGIEPTRGVNPTGF